MVEFEYPWSISYSGSLATLKFNANALHQLGALIFLDLPDQGADLKKGMPSISIEATNWIGTSKVPISGVVTKVNDRIAGLKSNQITDGDWILQLRTN